ncbi:MAG: NAD(P)/FAD-dependent oxidoreductase [Chitinophagales bacterium]
METLDVIVVGGGYAGLSCAYYLQQQGYNVKLFEASPFIGGRAKSEKINGFILDRGTHYYHHSTTELKKIINLKDLQLKNLYPGYLLRYEDSFYVYTNPLYKTIDTFSTAIAKNANLKDKLRMFSLFVKLKATPYNVLVKEKDTSTYEFLKKSGFSQQTINTLFRPMMAANIFDWNLQSSSKIAKLYLKSLFADQIALPKDGIGSIAEAISKQLNPASICIKSKIKQVTEDGVIFENGNFLKAKAVVIATNTLSANKLYPTKSLTVESTHVSTIYFESNQAPISKPIVLLNGEGKGIVNHIFIPTLLHSNYAPSGKHLIAVNIVKPHDFDDDELVTKVQVELANWFGLQVQDWNHIKTYHIKYAMPFQPILDKVEFVKPLAYNVFFAGDGIAVGTMESALRSGRETAQHIHQNVLSKQKSRREEAVY